MKILKIVLLIALISVLLYFFFSNLDMAEVAKIIKEINPIYPLLFLSGLFAQFFIRAYRWRIILTPFKKNISIYSLYNYIVIGFFINSIVPGRLGEPARGILLAGEAGIKKSEGLASVVLERMIDFLMIIVIFFSSLLFLDKTDSPIFISLKKGAIVLFPIIVFVFFLFYIINVEGMSGFIDGLIRLTSKPLPLKYREKWIESLGNFLKGLKLKLSVWNYIKLLISSLLVWVWLIPFYWFLMKGFEFGSGVSVIQTVPYFSIIVVSAAIPTPGMTGSLDAASKLGLMELYGYTGITGNQAGAFTLLVHVLILLVIIVPGIVAIKIKGLKIRSILGITDRDEVS